MTAPTCLLIGDSSMTIRCAEIWLASGARVAAIVTKNPGVSAWAAEQGVNVLQKSEAWMTAVAGIEFDYLFSASNLDMLPSNVFTCARKIALNFHDGPLPAYAGLNAPAWAVINGETTHGVTWHEITQAADMGRVAASAAVAIEENDTALSLNAKCYEVGIQCFETIVAAIRRGEPLPLTEQVGERTYFAKRKRPAHAATIDLSMPARTIVNLVRALYAGPYENPLGAAKLRLPGQMCFVGAAEEVEAFGAPHQIVAVEADAIVIGTATGAVRFSQLTCPRGLPIDLSGLKAGDAALTLTDEERAALAGVSPASVSSERAWLRALTQTQNLELPYPALLEGPSTHWTFHIENAGNLDQRIAALAAWAGRIADRNTLSFAYASQDAIAALGAAAPWYTTWRPLNVQIDDVRQADQILATARAECDARGPIACDLMARYAAVEAFGARPEQLSLAIFIGLDAPSHDAPVLALLDPDNAEIALCIRADRFDHNVAEKIADHVRHAAARWRDIDALEDLNLTDEEEAARIGALSIGPQPLIPHVCVHDLVLAQAHRTPERCAIRVRARELTYAQLAERVEHWAASLMIAGVQPGDVVGVHMHRGADLLVALLSVMRAGAAYLPLDPTYPTDRIAYMLQDAGVTVAVSDTREGIDEAGVCWLSGQRLGSVDVSAAKLPQVSPAALAYLMYTSGSTGRPKGVMIPHETVINFFLGMDERIPFADADCWLSVTSPSFDISVLEYFWTLSRGLTVAVHEPHAVHESPASNAPAFSLFYFSSSCGPGAYRLLLEGARYADENGFEAVWTPERHFHEFGGAFPNPSVSGAAIAAITSRVAIRAGSCVGPLHHPIRIAEEWAFVDNISNGRVGIAFASGWQPNDFVLMPDGFAQRKQIMMSRVEDVRALWRGEKVAFKNPHGAMVETRTLPRPVQPELPVWLTSAKNPETFAEAGRRGCNVLTHLLGMTVDEVAQNVRIYRAAWQAAGHAGEGRVTLMLHTYVADEGEDARAIVRAPMKQYLSEAVDLVRDAAWTFPTFVQKAETAGRTPAEIFESEPLTPAELDDLLDHAFERYYETSGLFGSVDRCVEIAARVRAIGIDEIACLIDFGLNTDLALARLANLKSVMDRAPEACRAAPAPMYSVLDDITFAGASHLQCTPSMAAMMVDDPRAAEAFSRLKVMMVGGEALTLSLARTLKNLAPSSVLLNMYGPTETTIWSTTSRVEASHEFIPLGAPIANTTLRVLSAAGREQPALVPGELWIGGKGLARGYWLRPELTAERFAHVAAANGETMYRTGDLVRRRADGVLEFLGRLDNQVKIRGHRIELGEIENTIEAYDGVAQAVVIAREDANGDKRLVAYYVEKANGAVVLDALQAHIAGALPEIMTPSAYMRLDAFPLTPNAKIDRNRLPAPQARQATQVESPAGSMEEAIAKIWGELLQIEAVGVTHNFFDLGGHSLLAVQVLRRLKTLTDKPLGITDIFRYPTVRGLAAYMDGASSESAAIDKARERAAARLGRRRARVGAES